jgi:hypothetical protein
MGSLFRFSPERTPVAAENYQRALHVLAKRGRVMSYAKVEDNAHPAPSGLELRSVESEVEDNAHPAPSWLELRSVESCA